ncbi:Hsp20/alpha crystallin family protein [Amycolatopsis australiensis]|uniref:HSP20 family protein n=1 Tax=Amycolatopsis australiensis TaxID=546364 RepID=A0A1K1S171_9PSEU|nr:Hsp20/alpha crystallin family protein [Amycolatopsis australiensis]SFW78089.1 HSP20 family protein [Amycolatopsis australiensis]
MLVRTDPFQAFDRLAQQFFGGLTASAAMPLDAYRAGDQFLVHLDLPGVRPESIEVDVEHNVLSVRAQRTTVPGDGAQVVVHERPAGTFTRRLHLGDNLDTDHVEASYDAGVLTLRIPVAEQAKPRKIAITAGTSERPALTA